jgi:hypothetical protein
LCDAQDAVAPYAAFKQTDVTAIYNALIASRSAGPDGTPFRSFASPSPNNLALAPPPSLPSASHPYARLALAQKVYNNISTTSNVFAVWLTVGFFEVVDESVRPQRLGAEIGRDLNRHIRHRMFAIVDRSALQLFSTTSAAAVSAGANQPMTFNVAGVSTIRGPLSVWNATQSYEVGDAVSNAGVAYYCIRANTNIVTATTAYWQPVVQTGMLLEVGTGANAEVVAVQGIAGNTITANFLKAHVAGESIVCRGNPGPQANYNPRRDTGVILHMSVIQ